MTVYVDELRPTPRNPNWPFSHGCHMVADTLEELHTMADQLGLKRGPWFQGTGKHPHYDLTQNKRRQAVAAGAVETTAREMLGKAYR